MNIRLSLRTILGLLITLVFITLSACTTVPNETGVLAQDIINVKHRDKKTQLTSSDNYTLLGAGYIANKNYEKAMTKLKKAIALSPDNARAYNYLGVLYWKLDENKLANNNFQRSYELSPLDAAIVHNYAMFLCADKKYKQANVFFERVFKNTLYDRLSQAYEQAGTCSFEYKDMNLSMKYFKKSLKLLPSNSEAMLGMSKVFYKLAKFKLAVYYYERAIQQMKQTPDSLWFGICLRREIPDHNKSASYILELKNLHPDSDETLFFIDGKTTY